MNLRNLIETIKSKGNKASQNNNHVTRDSADNAQDQQRFFNNSPGPKKVFHNQGKKQNQNHGQNNFMRKQRSVVAPSLQNSKNVVQPLEIKKHSSMRELPKVVDKQIELKAGSNQANQGQINLRSELQFQNHSKWPSTRSDTNGGGGATKNNNPTECDIEFLNWIKERNNQAPEKDSSKANNPKERDNIRVSSKLDEQKLRTSENKRQTRNHREEIRKGKLESHDNPRYMRRSRSYNRLRQYRKSRSRSRTRSPIRLRRSSNYDKMSHPQSKPQIERMVSQSEPKNQVLRQNGKPTFRQQLQDQIQNESQSQHIESRTEVQQTDELINHATTENNYNNNQNKNQNKDEEMNHDQDGVYEHQTDHDINYRESTIRSCLKDADEIEDEAIDGYKSDFRSRRDVPNLEEMVIDTQRDDQDQDVPFYILEQKERDKAYSNTNKANQKKILQQANESSQNTHLKNRRIQAHFLIIERFLDITKVILNRFQQLLTRIKKDYFVRIADNHQKLEALQDNVQAFSKETWMIFLEALKGEISQHQYTSIKHCLMRIFKACQIQLDDFVWKNGPYRESTFASAASTLENQTSTPIDSVNDPSDIVINEDLLKQRTQLLSELIEIEQVCKQYIDLINQSFYKLWDQLKTQVTEVSFQRIKQEYHNFNNYKEFAKPLKATNGIQKSLVNIFSQEEINNLMPENILMMFLLETGNTIDGVTIASKLLSQVNFNQSLAHNFQVYQNWKKRKCHCCMEFILDAGKAVTCVNLTREQDPCNNLYCQNCVIAFLEEKHYFEEDDLAKQSREASATAKVSESGKSEAEKKSIREKEEKKTKHKLWLKALQNILFVCPCCQGYCLNDNPNLRKLEFSQFSVCNFNYKLTNHPRSFLRRDVYWYRVQGIKKLFYLAKFVGINKQKQLHKIEVLQTSQTYLIKLSKEEIFFTNTVKPGTKLFKIIDQQGTELDLRSQLEKQIKDFATFKTYPILERYINFLDKQEGYLDGFHIPKFEIKKSHIRMEFLQCHRDLYRRQDYQLFDTFAYNIECLYKNAKSSFQTTLQSEKVPLKQQENFQIKSIHAQEKPFEIQKDCQKVGKPRQPLDEHDRKLHQQQLQLLSRNNMSQNLASTTYAKFHHVVLENPLKNIVVNPGEQQNIGMLMTSAKNIELAKALSGNSENFNLLITKEVFKIEKVRHDQNERAKQPIDSSLNKFRTEMVQVHQQPTNPVSSPPQIKQKAKEQEQKEKEEKKVPPKLDKVDEQNKEELLDSSSPVSTPVSKQTQAPAQKPAQAPAQKPASNPAQKSAQAPAQKPAQAPVQKPTSAPVSKSVPEPTSKPAPAPASKVAAAPASKTATEPATKTATAPISKPATRTDPTLPPPTPPPVAATRTEDHESEEKELASFQDLIESKQTKGRKRGMGTNKKDKTYAEIIKEIRNGEKKEYNLRRSGNTNTDNWWQQQHLKHVNTSRELKNLQKYDLSKQEKHKSPKSTSTVKNLHSPENYSPQRSLRQRKEQKPVEDGFYDDFPVEVIRKYKLKVSSTFKKKLQEDKKKTKVVNKSKRQESTGQQSSAKQEQKSTPAEQTQKISSERLSEAIVSKTSNPSMKSNLKTGESNEQEKVPPFKQRFKMTDKLIKHCQKFGQQIKDSPENLLNSYIYMFREDKNIWRRGKLIKLASSLDEEKRVFHVELQDANKKQIKVNLLAIKFFVDKQQQQSLQKNSDQQEKKDESEKKIQEQVDKLLKFPFNSKKRVSKLLDKVKASGPSAGTPTQQTPVVVAEENPEAEEKPQTESKIVAHEDKKVFSIEKQPVKEASKETQEEKVSSKVHIQFSQDVEEKKLSPAKIEIPLQIEPIKIILSQREEQQKQDQQKAEEDIEPKEEWIKGMGVQLISKQGNSKTKKVLKFYTQIINENELDSDEDHQLLIDQWRKTIQNQQLQIQQAETLNQYFSQIHQQPIFDPLDEQVDQQKLKIYKLMEQIKQQQLIKKQYDLIAQDPNLIYNHYQQQMILGYGFDDPMQYQLAGMHPQEMSLQEMVPLTEEQIFNQLRIVNESVSANDRGTMPQNHQQVNNIVSNPEFVQTEKKIESQLNQIQKQTEELKQNFIKEENLQQRIMKLKQLQNYQLSKQNIQKEDTYQEYDPQNIPQALNQIQRTTDKLWEQVNTNNNDENIESVAVQAEDQNSNNDWYIKQVQKSLDQLELIKMIDNPEQAQEAFTALEDGMLLLEQGFNEAKCIEEQIMDRMQIDQSFTESQQEASLLVDNIYRSDSDQDEEENECREAKLEYFANMIQEIEVQLNNNMKKRSTIKLQSKRIKKSKIQLNPAFELDFAQFNKKKKKIMRNYYKKMIAFKGYKKCTCPACFKQVYPMLIKYDADSLSFLEQHQSIYNQFRQETENPLLQLMCQKKKERQLKVEIQVQQKRICQMNSKEEYQNRLYPLFESRECEQVFPLFGALTKKVNDEMERDLENSERQDYEKLPKISQIYLYTSQINDKNRGQPIINEKFDYQLDVLQQQMHSRLKLEQEKSEFDTQSYNTEAYEHEKNMLNEEFESIKQIQKQLRKMQLQKIESLRQKKLKYEKQKYSVCDDKIRALKDRAQKLIN